VGDRPQKHLSAGEGATPQGVIVNGRMPLYLTILLAAVFGTVMLLVQPYSWRAGAESSSRWEAYLEPARRFLQAAVRKDSLALVQQSTNAEPVAWALAAARRQPDSLRIWAREAWVWTGSSHGDTTEVLYSAHTSVCPDQPIWLRFVGPREDAKVVEAGSACFQPH
jgi:hypothetical protein